MEQAFKHRANSKEMLAQYTSAAAATANASSCGPLASPRGSAQHCKYKSGKCSNPRATKRNGQLHTLCHFHRIRQNEHQRKSDRKHRMVSVARRAKLGSMGMGVLVGGSGASTPLGGNRRGPRHSICSNTSDVSSSDAPSTPASPMDIDRAAYDLQGGEHQLDGAFLNPYHLHNHSRGVQQTMADANSSSSGAFPGTPTGGRLPPISFLTQQLPGKLDSFRSSTTPASLTLPPPSSFMKGSNVNSQAGKMA
uniref:Uncharacterized protein n=1 Tax=Globisporangium ultimum (strain ATCC 200006 / CBS 805.95 / DAOM BR144) TaxID=431595 RepID=K3WN24_GLOUD